MKLYWLAWSVVLALTACGGVEEQEQTEDQDALECQINKIQHYTYRFGGSYYRADVSYNFSTGRTWFDQKKIGGERLPQHSVTPYWPSCPSGNQTIALRSGGHQHLCTSVCLNDTQRELHCDSSDLPGGGPVQLLLNYEGLSYACSY